jgi:hypothetical protein
MNKTIKIVVICFLLFCCSCSVIARKEESSIDKSVLVSEDHAVISPSGQYSLKMDVTKEEGVRGFHVAVCSIDNKGVFRSKEFFRFRDANFLLWGDDDTFWVYSGDVGTFYWVKTGDSWEKKSYSENRDSVMVPDTLKLLRPSSFA